MQSFVELHMFQFRDSEIILWAVLQIKWASCGRGPHFAHPWSEGTVVRGAEHLLRSVLRSRNVTKHLHDAFIQ